MSDGDLTLKIAKKGEERQQGTKEIENIGIYKNFFKNEFMNITTREFFF